MMLKRPGCVGLEELVVELPDGYAAAAVRWVNARRVVYLLKGGGTFDW